MLPLMIFGKIYSIDNSSIIIFNVFAYNGYMYVHAHMLENNGLCIHNCATQLAKLKIQRRNV